MTTSIKGTDVPATGNKQVDAAIGAQAQANAQSIALSTKTNTSVTELNAITSSVRKIQPS